MDRRGMTMRETTGVVDEPVAAAPLKFDADGQVDWASMWDGF